MQKLNSIIDSLIKVGFDCIETFDFIFKYFREELIENFGKENADMIEDWLYESWDGKIYFNGETILDLTKFKKEDSFAALFDYIQSTKVN